jgi:hypothetical protein
MAVLPADTLAAKPALPTVATAGLSELQLAVAVRSWVLPSL